MNGNNSLKGKIIGTLFLIWFIGSIVGLMYFSKINGYYTIMIFGQYFLVFSVIPLINSKGMEKLFGVPFALVGLACIIIPYVMMHPELVSFTIVWDSVIPLLLILAFIIAGLAMIIIPKKREQRLNKVCNVTVFATITSHDYTYSDKGTKLYAPIYSFEFNKQKYEISNNQYTNIGVKPVGTIVELKINPNNPKEFLDNSSFSKLIIVMGVIFLIISAPIFIYMLTTLQFIQ